MVSLLDACHILSHRGLTKSVKPFEDALIGEVQATVAVAAILLRWLLEGTLLGDVSLFVAVVAECYVLAGM